jgi:hypothetical protein
MPHERPEAGCHQIDFQASYPVGEGAEVALEDYARALTRALSAEAVRADDGATLRGVHGCGVADPEAAGAPALRRDIEDFARSLVTGTGGGLGWS